MASKKVKYRIIHQNGIAVYFNVIDSELMPLANFDVAYRWFKEGVLTTTSELEILELIKDPGIEEKYKKFLDEEKQIIASYMRKKTKETTETSGPHALRHGRQARIPF